MAKTPTIDHSSGDKVQACVDLAHELLHTQGAFLPKGDSSDPVEHLHECLAKLRDNQGEMKANLEELVAEEEKTTALAAHPQVQAPHIGALLEKLDEIRHTLVESAWKDRATKDIRNLETYFTEASDFADMLFKRMSAKIPLAKAIFFHTPDGSRYEITSTYNFEGEEMEEYATSIGPAIERFKLFKDDKISYSDHNFLHSPFSLAKPAPTGCVCVFIPFVSSFDIIEGGMEITLEGAVEIKYLEYLRDIQDPIAKNLLFCRTLNQVQELLDIINDLLDIGKIEAGKLAVEPAAVDIGKVMAFLQKTFEPIALDKGLEFKTTIEPGTPETLMSDPLRLRQILKNFLSNAVKFTFEGNVLLTAKPATWDPAENGGTPDKGFASQ